MGALFWVLGYISGFLTLVLLSLAVSSGLYLLAELAEEFPTMSGTITKYLLVVVVSLHVLLFIDGLPVCETCVGMMSHLMYASMLANFPFVNLVSVSTIGSAIGFVWCNLMWLSYFTKVENDPLQIIGFFVVCVWAVPCAFFVSLTPNDNKLPTASTPASIGIEGATGTDMDSISGKKKSFFKVISDFFMGSFEKLTSSGLFEILKKLNDKRK
jgi:hypothetical protein